MHRKSKRILSLSLVLCMCMGLFTVMPVHAVESEAAESQTPIYMDPSYSYAERAADLVGRMSTAQKGSQVTSQNAPAIVPTMLGGGALDVPATTGVNGYTWWQEALHGYLNAQNANSYPQNTSVGNTWNPDLYYTEAGYIGDEIRERASKISSGENAGNAVNLTVYSPTVNLHRDPRWGRNEESYSEDPYLMSKMGSAFVQGIQGMDRNGNPLDPDGRRKVNATIKHYVANNSEKNRLDGGAKTSLRALREYYAAPYRDIIDEANVSSVMQAYSTLNGDPCTWSSYLIETLLRQTYGFSGYMTGDCDSVMTISRHNFTNPYTGKVLTTVEQLSQAMAHGMDLECNGGHGSGSSTYGSNMANMLAQAVTTDKGKFTENQLDVSLHRLMTARMQTGEWDSNNPFTREAAARVASQTGSVGWQTSERLKMIDDMNAEAVIMLKNTAPAGSENKVLPLAVPAAGAYKVVIVGAWQTNAYTGLYSAQQNNNTNRINIQQRIYNNIYEINKDTTFTYLTSYGNSTSASSYTISEADQATIAAADAVIVVTGTTENYSREDSDRTSIVLPNEQARLISNVGKLNPKTIAVMETCGPMQVTQFENDVAGILWSSYLGNRKVGFGDVITGKVNPSGKTTDTWYQNVSDTGTSDIPSIYDYDLYPSEGKQGRTYMYFTGTPSYPFGYGLSYTNFNYSNLTIKNGSSEASEFDANDTISVSFDVTNTGSMKGKETTQLYIAQPNAPAELMRPIKRLQGFDKIELEPNETKTVTMNVKIPDLAYYDEDSDRFIVDTGAYEIQVGKSSADVLLKGNINVSGQMTVVPAVLSAKPSQTGDEELGVEERLIFDNGKIVDPKLTVAMNDESLWGYIIKQQSSHVKQKSSTEFPEGMEFSYYSNRPDVVSVTGDIIKTEAPGVATITATATYHGVSVSTDFVVYVVSTPYLDGIKVNGVSVAGFKPDRMNYAVELPAGTTDIPTIEPIYTNADLDVTYDPLTSVPGVASINCTNKMTGTTVTYRVGVGCKPVSTDFKEGEDAAQAKGWSFMNKNDNAVFDGAGLTIATERGAFSNVDFQPKNVFKVAAFGDWVAQTQVKLSEAPAASNQQAGLIVYDDAKNYIRFVYGRPTTGSSNVIRVYNVVNGTETQSNTATLATQTSVIFQVIKQGDTFSFNYSFDGTTWTKFGTNVTANYAFPQIGLFANNGDVDATPISVTYENLSVFSATDLLPRLTSLSVNGSPVVGFNPEVLGYNVEVPLDATVAPVLEATADPAYVIKYNQINTATGAASVTVSTQAASVTYTVYFNTVPISDYFADGTIGSQWSVLRENKATYSIEKGLGLRLPTQSGDIYSTGGSWTNVFVQPAMGNWEVVAKVFYPNKPTANYQQAMLLVWQDENNYIRANCQQNSLKLEPGIERNGSMSGTNGPNAVASADGTVTLYHKITKEGTTYTVAYSQDGENYTKLVTYTGVDYKDPKIGMFATQNSNSAQMNTYFEYLTITNLNGVQQKSYQQMLQDAVDHVRDYVAAGIPSATFSDIVFSKLPHGYTMSVESSDESVITNSGKVNPSTDTEKSATLTVTISDGTREAVSEPIPVVVKASLPRMKMTGSSTVKPESTFSVGVGVYNVSQDIYAEDITLNFDPEVFEYDTVTSDNPNVNILIKDSDAGKLRIVAANIGGVKGDADSLLNVSFKVKDGVKDVESVLSIIKAKLGVMPDGTIIEPALASKTIGIGSTPDVNKRILGDLLSAAQTAYDTSTEGNEPGQYPADARAAFLEAINAANAVYRNPDATQAEVNAAVTALSEAKSVFDDSVVPQPGVDKRELETAIIAAQRAYDASMEGNEPGQYPAAAREAFLTAINAANLVLANPNATQTEVNREVEALAAAKAIFDGSVIPMPTADKTQLKAAIDESQALHDRAVVGTADGNYRQADKNIFQQAIDAAKTVFDNAGATQEAVDNATIALKAAKAAFEASVITKNTGDLNNSDAIDVGDLAIIAYYYGVKSDDANWQTAKIADMNNDGRIDIEDLAFIAQRIGD